jgi:hypothetical protein
VVNGVVAVAIYLLPLLVGRVIPLNYGIFVGATIALLTLIKDLLKENRVEHKEEKTPTSTISLDRSS